MRDPTVYAFDDSEWEVPAHEVALYADKRHKHALVIPVINEGERIRGQLLRVQAANLPVDVIVADGGSTDGSLDADFVAPAGVRCVLTKTGPGKLSAQLRMAYAWVIRQGYDGVVTIDGNGKDGVEAVAAMVAKLEEGCDYVQGSRYLPGGEAENTPLERTIANRLIHAPLLSIAGRRIFLDTTNGFRAYSTRYLTHPQVKPFRDIFQVYNLLFYLTVRAGQLGLKVGHCPVVRRYPDSGKVPTKIGGLSSKLALLGETVVAATGGYTPDEDTEAPALWGWTLLITLLVCLPLFISTVISPPYSPDSWAFYELSRTVFGDFYRVDHIRSYTADTPYSAAFPPLWPSLIGVVDAAFGTGARTGLYLAFASFAAFALLSEKVGRAVTGVAWFGLAAALALLLGPKMVGIEMTAGRTVPLQLALFALIVLGLTRGGAISVWRGAAIGAVTGLAVLNRFDALPLPILVAALTFWPTRKPGVALAVIGAALAILSPWITYSLTTFGSVFATDNAGVATSLDPRAFVTDWWPTPQPTMADDPLGWVGKVIGHTPRFIWIAGSIAVSPLGLAYAVAVAMAGGLAAFALRAPHKAEVSPLADKSLRAVIGFAAITALLLGPQLLTGYIEYRYFTAAFWAGFLALGAWIIGTGISRTQRQTYACLMAISVGVALVSVAALKGAATLPTHAPAWSQFDEPRDVRVLEQCLGDTPKARVMVLGDDTFAAKAGALAGLTTMMAPRNMMDGRLQDQLGVGSARAFLKEQRVDYALVMGPAHTSFAQEDLGLARAPGCPLALYGPVTR
ncbi:MAG: glycosyltransferase family 2 protein [Pseudomonadota bacterium]